MILLNNSAGYFSGTKENILVEFQTLVQLTALSTKQLLL